MNVVGRQHQPEACTAALQVESRDDAGCTLYSDTGMQCCVCSYVQHMSMCWMHMALQWQHMVCKAAHMDSAWQCLAGLNTRLIAGLNADEFCNFCWQLC